MWIGVSYSNRIEKPQTRCVTPLLMISWQKYVVFVNLIIVKPYKFNCLISHSIKQLFVIYL